MPLCPWAFELRIIKGGGRKSVKNARLNKNTLVLK
jgi:hypothetical protein